jgi:hypothetical protein
VPILEPPRLAVIVRNVRAFPIAVVNAVDPSLRRRVPRVEWRDIGIPTQRDCTNGG